MDAFSWPAYFPGQAKSITSKSAISLAARYKRSPLFIPKLGRNVETAFVPPKNLRGKPPICFLHGFDSSSFDFRKLLPYVEQAGYETWAVDLVGWGMSDHSIYLMDPSLPCGPEIKSNHLYQFWKKFIDRPMCLFGVSLGGAVAVDFTLKHPEAVDSIILSSSQGYIDGLGALSRVPRFIAKLGVQVLQTKALRRYANGLAYADKSVDIDQAMLVGRVHTLLPGWIDASLSFIKSDGYSISSRIKEVEVPALIMWGRLDQVLDRNYAARFHSDIKDSKLIWIDDCGHAGHLEKFDVIGDHTKEFLRQRSIV